MAGFDLATQFSGQIGSGLIEYGEFDFSTGSDTQDVPTRLTRVVMGFGIASTKDPDWQGLVATTDGDVSSSSLTWARQTSYVDETLNVHYMVLGY